MDSEGYLPVSLIASFNRVQALTGDITFIVQAVQHSQIVDVNEDGMSVSLLLWIHTQYWLLSRKSPQYAIVPNGT